MLTSGERLSSTPLNISPRKQLVDPVNLVVGNATENISQPCLRIDTIELGRLSIDNWTCPGFIPGP
jgi:hypothetical protein